MKLYILTYTRNVLTLLIFAKLAVHFDKWWIIFFSFLFWCYVEG